MTQAFWNPGRSRKIQKRIVVKGALVLQTPASFSNGDTEDLVDIPLLTDATETHRPLLTGASLAGALRSYISGFGGSYAELLFGGKNGQEDGEQSPLIVDDAIGEAPTIELRDGVKIDSKTRTALEKALYNREMWAAGTTFDLRLELLISPIYFVHDPQNKERRILKERSSAEMVDYEAQLKSAFATVLNGLAIGEIPLGGRKTRGYGRGSVGNWTVDTYDMGRAQDLKAWLENVPPPIPSSLGTGYLTDQRSLFEIKATFALEGSLLIRREGGNKIEPDMAHLRARQADGTEKPILSGTSLAGALRARAYKIANTLGLDAKSLTDGIFGSDMEAIRKRKRQGERDILPHASRLRVSEQTIENGVEDLVQSRVSLDRFTGGALDTALFNEQPLFSRGETTTVEITLSLKKPSDAEIGLLLSLLKDLWTADLALGGESSVGRGRLNGIEAIITHSHSDRAQPTTWKITQGIDGGLILPEDTSSLQAYVLALQTWKPLGADKMAARANSVETEQHNTEGALK